MQVEGGEPVSESEGIRLWLSNMTPTGYKGVYADGRGFRAQRRKNGSQVVIGRYDSAVEAAVAYARDAGQAPAPAAHETPLAEEKDGEKLHLSSRSNTGYRGVHRRNGAQGVRFQASKWEKRCLVTLGTFKTAVDAALAVARAVGDVPEALPLAAHSLLLSLPSPLTGLG